jgi:glycosyltransferase involved in cell wall biosynthesis
VATRRPSVVILSLAPVRRDGRVLREIAHAALCYRVTVVAWGSPDDVPPDVTIRPVTPIRLSRRTRVGQVALLLGGRASPGLWDRWYWRKPDHRLALAHVIAARPDLIHVNEAIALPVAVRAAEATGARVMFDAHEYSPDQFKDHRVLRFAAAPLYRHLIGRYAPRADAMVTVAPSIAERYRQVFGLACDVILNAPSYQRVTYRPVDPARIRLVHHGVALRGRHIERTIEALARTDGRFSLELMLVDGSPGHVDELRRLGARVAPGRVLFRTPVPPERIVDAISTCDVGVALIPPVDFNYAHALPNKLFEFLMAGLVVAVGPSPEMARIVREHGCGVVADDFSPAALAASLNALTPDAIDALKLRALDAARIFNAETEMAKLAGIYQHLLGAPRHAARDRACDGGTSVADGTA